VAGVAGDLLAAVAAAVAAAAAVEPVVDVVLVAGVEPDVLVVVVPVLGFRPGVPPELPVGLATPLVPVP